MLESGGQLGLHHFFPVDQASIGDEGAVANRVDGSFFVAGGVEIGGDAFEHDDVVPIYYVGDPAFDICQALLDERRPDVFGFDTGETKFRELVRIPS